MLRGFPMRTGFQRFRKFLKMFSKLSKSKLMRKLENTGTNKINVPNFWPFFLRVLLQICQWESALRGLSVQNFLYCHRLSQGATTQTVLVCLAWRSDSVSHVLKG
jgi:hypothetical protein